MFREAGMNSKMSSNRNVTRVLRRLQEQHRKSLAHAIHYNTGWERAADAFAKLQAFRVGIARQKAVGSREEMRTLAA